MKRLLAENKFGHNRTRSNRVVKQLRKIRRYRRGFVKGMATVPFDWNTGYDAEILTGPIAVKNQYQSFSCGGQSVAYLIEIIEKIAGNKEGPISAKSIYDPTAYPGGGTTTVALEKQVSTLGANLEALVSSYKDDGTTDEAFMTDTSYLTDSIKLEALKRAGYVPKSIPIDMDSIAWATKTYGAVVIEIMGQNNGTWLNPCPNPPIKGMPTWNHFMCVKQAKNMGEPKIGVINSWGQNVGNHGQQYFNSDHLPFILDCFTFVKPTPVVIPTIPIPTPTKQSYTLWQKIVMFLLSLFISK